VADPATLAAWLWGAFAAVEVARHWGYDSARRDAAIVVVLLLILLGARIRSSAPRWPPRLREHGIVVASAAVIAGSVAVMLGGAYMGDRFATSEQDFEAGSTLARWARPSFHPDRMAAGQGLGHFRSATSGRPMPESRKLPRLERRGQRVPRPVGAAPSVHFR
jgi:hypothetical protein